MAMLRGLLDRLVLVSAVVAGGLVPGFIAQYRQRLGGRLDQALLDLGPWQKIADQFWQGDMDRLVQYHLASTDATFHAEGAVIQSLRAAVQQLQGAVAAMQGSLFQQFRYLGLHTDAGIARATYGDWVPTFALSAEGLVFAALSAVTVWLLFQAAWWLISRASEWIARR
jgi:hypothetical protein